MGGPSTVVYRWLRPWRPFHNRRREAIAVRSLGSSVGSSQSPSLEGVWRTAVRAVELETLMLVSSRGYPLLTMVNGPLMA
jgi:hypothetical protein